MNTVKLIYVGSFKHLEIFVSLKHGIYFKYLTDYYCGFYTSINGFHQTPYYKCSFEALQFQLNSLYNAELSKEHIRLCPYTLTWQTLSSKELENYSGISFLVEDFNKYFFNCEEIKNLLLLEDILE